MRALIQTSENSFILAIFVAHHALQHCEMECVDDISKWKARINWKCYTAFRHKNKNEDSKTKSKFIWKAKFSNWKQTWSIKKIKYAIQCKVREKHLRCVVFLPFCLYPQCCSLFTHTRHIDYLPAVNATGLVGMVQLNSICKP